MTTFSPNLCPIVLTAPTCRQRQDELLGKIAAAPRNSVILAGELCVSGYDTGGFFSGANGAMSGDSIGSFDAILFKAVQEALSPDKFLGLTHLTSLNRAKGLAQISITQTQKNEIYNEFILLNNQNVFYAQNKSKLFRPNLEHEIFAAGDDATIRPFDFKGLKIGVLICFELRFAHLWQQLKGCDVILVPAMWGKALAIANSCYVVAASSLDLEFSGVFLPSGEFAKEVKFDPNLILETKRNLGLL